MLSRVGRASLLLMIVALNGCADSDEVATPQPRIKNAAEPRWVADEVQAQPTELNDGDSLSAPLPSMNPELPVREPVQAEKVYRPDDTRSQPDDERLAELGIHKFESRRLILYTDIDPEVAVTLPPLADQAYDALVAYFGEPPPVRSGAVFQLTGYLIREEDRFLAAELIPVDLNRFDHGQHRGQEFWMYEQDYDYYRRHLLIHEVTHCFMLILPGLHPPLWYLEGMAEFFATHRLLDENTAEFGVMPDESKSFVGFGRVEMIQEEIAAGRLLNIDQATELGQVEFAASRSIPYAWSWALCKFLDAHPRYQARFRQLGQHLVGKEFVRLAKTLFADDKLLLAAEWDQFVQQIDYGWDFEANAFQLAAQPAPNHAPLEVDVAANQGWQMTGLVVKAGEPYPITASGTVVLAEVPKPWISEPQGISIRYAGGQPIGRLRVGVFVHEAPTTGVIFTPFEVHDCGRGDVIRFSNSGLLCFQVNDFGSERHDNSGSYQVRVLPHSE